MTRTRAARICFFCALALLGGVLRAEDMRDGIAFVKGLSGSLTADGRTLTKHESFDPVGKTIVSDSSGHSCLVFSNRLALVFEPDTTLVVREFRQALPDGSASTPTMSRWAVPRSTSSLNGAVLRWRRSAPGDLELELELPQCTLDGGVSELYVSLDSVPAQVVVLDGNLRVKGNGGRRMLVQSGQWLDLGKAGHLSERDMLGTLDTTHESAARQRPRWPRATTNWCFLRRPLTVGSRRCAL